MMQLSYARQCLQARRFFLRAFLFNLRKRGVVRFEVVDYIGGDY